MGTNHITEAFLTTPDIDDLGVINLQESGKYRIAQIRPRPTTWVLGEASSPYVHGSTITSARKERGIITLTVVVEGNSHAALIANASVLCRAVEQLRYRFGFKWDDVPYEWYCGPSTHRIGGDGLFDGSLFRVNRMIFSASLNREPIAIEGPF